MLVQSPRVVLVQSPPRTVSLDPGFRTRSSNTSIETVFCIIGPETSYGTRRATFNGVTSHVADSVRSSAGDNLNSFYMSPRLSHMFNVVVVVNQNSFYKSLKIFCHVEIRLIVIMVPPLWILCS